MKNDAGLGKGRTRSEYQSQPLLINLEKSPVTGSWETKIMSTSDLALNPPTFSSDIQLLPYFLICLSDQATDDPLALSFSIDLPKSSAIIYRSYAIIPTLMKVTS